MTMSLAINEPKCEGCRHRDDPDKNGWCYMFCESPENLPCAQHDKFKHLRMKGGPAGIARRALIGTMIAITEFGSSPWSSLEEKKIGPTSEEMAQRRKEHRERRSKLKDEKEKKKIEKARLKRERRAKRGKT